MPSTSNSQDGAKRYLTIEELADELGVTKATIYMWRHRGEGPKGAIIGRSLRFRREDIEQWWTERAS